MESLLEQLSWQESLLLDFMYIVVFWLVIGMFITVGLFWKREELLPPNPRWFIVILCAIFLWPFIAAYACKEERKRLLPNYIVSMEIAPDFQGYTLCDARGNQYPFASAYLHEPDEFIALFEPTEKHRQYLIDRHTGVIYVNGGQPPFKDVVPVESITPDPFAGFIVFGTNTGLAGYVFTEGGLVVGLGEATHYGDLRKHSSKLGLGRSPKSILGDRLLAKIPFSFDGVSKTFWSAKDQAA